MRLTSHHTQIAASKAGREGGGAHPSGAAGEDDAASAPALRDSGSGGRRREGGRAEEREASRTLHCKIGRQGGSGKMTVMPLGVAAYLLSRPRRAGCWVGQRFARASLNFGRGAHWAAEDCPFELQARASPSDPGTRL